MSERITITLLGRTIGTASGWDGDPGEWVCYYDFKPLEGIALPSGDLQVSDTKGTVGLSDEDGKIVAPQDIVLLLSTIPRDEPLGD